MLKRTLLLLALVSAVGIALPGKAVSSQIIVGRVTDYNATSLSVRDREILTVTLDTRTAYTKLVTQKPWQEDTRLSAGALSVGRFAPTPSPFAAPTSTSGDLLTLKQVTALVATANTAADHVTLQRHFLALAAKEARDLASAHGRMAAAK